MSEFRAQAIEILDRITCHPAYIDNLAAMSHGKEEDPNNSLLEHDVIRDLSTLHMAVNYLTYDDVDHLAQRIILRLSNEFAAHVDENDSLTQIIDPDKTGMIVPLAIKLIKNQTLYPDLTHRIKVADPKAAFMVEISQGLQEIEALHKSVAGRLAAER